MPRGSVTVAVNKAGRKVYRVRYDVPSADGARAQRQRTFATKRAADEFLARTLADISGHTYIEPDRTPTGVFLKEWVETVGSTRKSSTVYQYRTAIANRFGAIAAVPLSDLRPAHIHRLVETWKAEGYSIRTQNTTFRTLRTALRDAVRDRRIPRDPTADMPLPNARITPPTVWSGAHIQRFLAATADDHEYPLWLTLFTTLARVGELCTLYWSDIDFERQELTIARTLRRDEHGKWIIGADPKSQTSRRIIPMPASLLDVIASIPRQHDPLVFHKEDGTPLSEAYVYYRLKGAIARVGNLPPLSPHGARHSGATWLIENGTPIKVVSQYLGHSDAAFTLRMYVHHDADARKRAADSLSSLTRAQTVRIVTTEDPNPPDTPGETSL